MIKICLTVLFMSLIMQGLVSCTSSTGAGAMHISYLSPPPSLASNPLWQGNAQTTWDQVQRLSTIKLTDMQNKTNDPYELGWIKLAILTKQKNLNSNQLAEALLAWRGAYPNHPGNQMLPDNGVLKQLQTRGAPKQIAVLLPEAGMLKSAGQAVREGFLNAYYANQSNGIKPKLKFYDTSQATSMLALYQQAVAEGADFIIGPLTKNEVQQLKITPSFQTPTLALNYSENSSKTLNFYEYGLLPEDEIAQIAIRAKRAGYGKAIVIAPENEWGKRLASAFIQDWQVSGGSVEETWYFKNRETFNEEVAALMKVDQKLDKKLMKKDNNKDILAQQRRQDVDVIFLFAQAQDARLIVPLLRFYYAGNLPIYATASVFQKNGDPAQMVDLNGVMVCDIPWKLKALKEKEVEQLSKDRLYAVGQDAYLLSQSLQRLIDLPQFPVYGSTGAMTLSAEHQIHRRIPCVPINHDFI